MGENEFVEKNEDAEIIKRLGFSKCRLSLAMPKDIEYPGVKWFHGKKIATSYPGILSGFLKENGVNAEIHVITGSVEVAPGIGLADAIFDIVSSGSTLVSNRLKEVEVVMKSEALLIGNKNMSEETARVVDAEIKRLVCEAHEGALNILKEKKEDWERLSEALIEYETLTGEEIRQVINGEKINKSAETPVDPARQTHASVPEL